jgi:hypothetical protein
MMWNRADAFESANQDVKKKMTADVGSNRDGAFTFVSGRGCGNLSIAI